MLVKAMDDLSSFLPRQRDVRRRFDRIAADFDEADVVHRVTGDGLLERLQPMQLEARRVLELGAATGTLSRQLSRHFRRSQVVSVDLSLPMLREARRHRGWFSRVRELQASAEQLPLADDSADVVVANQLLPWLGPSPAGLKEVARVLRPEGLFAFASLGPDSFRELRAAFEDGDAHVHSFADMHDVGDALVRAGLRDPVLDVDRLELSYRDTQSLYRDLRRCGGNTLTGRRQSLTGKERFRRADKALDDSRQQGSIRISLELVYGHAWGAKVSQTAGEFRVDVADLRGRRRQR
ncbi:MAG: methyltransferase domain-containing protein [Woeseia sp.]|nr:methyltransferase domain-containing protein [Woeseia sp.]